MAVPNTLAMIRSHRVDREHFAPFIQRSWAADDPVTRVLSGADDICCIG
jgi:hypothetical protein